MILPRRRLLLYLVASAIGLGLGLWLLRPHQAITRRHAAQIKNGMTLAEVESLLGGPERIETTGPTEGDGNDRDDRPEAQELAAEQFLGALIHLTQTRRLHAGSLKRTWGSDDVAIFVLFDAEERVIGCAVRPLRRAPETIIAMLCRWLHL
jgi:hypothetical protein